MHNTSHMCQSRRPGGKQAPAAITRHSVINGDTMQLHWNGSSAMRGERACTRGGTTMEHTGSSRVSRLATTPSVTSDSVRLQICKQGLGVGVVFWQHPAFTWQPCSLTLCPTSKQRLKAGEAGFIAKQHQLE